MKKLLAIMCLCCAMVFGALQAHAATARLTDSSQMNLSAINAIAAKPVGGIPVGTVIAWPVANNPEDGDKWLECNGQSISASVYPELFALVGSTLPDFRGLFLRGTGGNAAPLGVQQGDAIRNIVGRIAIYEGGNAVQADGVFSGNSIRWGVSNLHSYGDNTSPEFRFDASRQVPTADENRPVNKAVRYLIKAMP